MKTHGARPDLKRGSARVNLSSASAWFHSPINETANAARGIVIGNNPGTIDTPIHSDSTAGTRVVLHNTAYKGLMDLRCRKVKADLLTIRGGADLAETFAMSQSDVEPGTVVVIDEANPGKLRQSTHAYDNSCWCRQWSQRHPTRQQHGALTLNDC